MCSKTRGQVIKSAAWRLSVLAGVGFAVASAAGFVAVYFIVLASIQKSSDVWLTGEAGVLAEIAATTPPGRLYDRLIREAAELATNEVPDAHDVKGGTGRLVFFLQTSRDGSPLLWVGPKHQQAFLDALSRAGLLPGIPQSIPIQGWRNPFRVVRHMQQAGNDIFLGHSQRHMFDLLHKTAITFFFIWLTVALLGLVVSWYGAHQILRRVEVVTETAAQIGMNDLTLRVPEGGNDDEIAHLVRTFNLMLDRIETSVIQIRTLADAITHDLRSPITSVRGALEAALTRNDSDRWQEPVASAIEGLDRLSGILNTTLDVAEAEAGALRLHLERTDFSGLVHEIVELYRPLALEKGLEWALQVQPDIQVEADVGLVCRALSNLLENEVTHLPSSSQVRIMLSARDRQAKLVIADDGPGFPPELQTRVFERFVKGPHSNGFGIGLSLVRAVARAHGGEAMIGEPCERYHAEDGR
jgi:signal transduction histidine kinase